MTTATVSKEVTYLEAISQALDEEMSRDERVFLMGEDIGIYGGAFRITEGFLQKFGEWRVLDTPLSESGFVGAAIGAAMMGLRPVVEMQFADFISCAFDQITEVAAKNHYRWGAAVPLVIRAPFGGGVHGGPFHSECPEGWFFHSPGLKIVAPSTPYDAKGLLISAIRDPNPVLYFEHKFLYRRIKAVLPEGDWVVPIGKADVSGPAATFPSSPMEPWSMWRSRQLRSWRRTGLSWRCWICDPSCRSTKRPFSNRSAKPARRSCCTRTTRRAASGRRLPRF